MTTSVRDDVSTAELRQHLSTTVSGDSALAGPSTDRLAAREIWDGLIDSKLIEWGRDPSRLEDDDFVAPSKAIIYVAINVAEAFRDLGKAPPLRVVPNGEGGIAFEREAGSVFESLEIHADGSVTVDLFRDFRLVATTPLDVLLPG